MFRYLLVLLSILCFCSSSIAGDLYNIDPSHSYVGWRISHFNFSHPQGKWYADGTLELDEKNPQKSHVNATINLDNMITGIPKLDEHLKSEEFFDVAKYPTAKFVSDKITVTGKDTAKVVGQLTLHGVTKPVTLNVKLNKAGESPITKKMTAGFSATAKIKRSDFGISTFLPGLGDDVDLTIEVEAIKAS